MLETKKPFAAALALALLGSTGCYNFDAAYEDCVKTGRCEPTDCNTSAVDLPDDLFHDANCDLFDGAADGGFFVDPSGGLDEVNPGTREAPFKTLTHALQRAAASDNKTIYLAKGDYNEPGLQLTEPISLYGGYAGVDGGWKRSADNTARLSGGSIGLTVNRLDAGVILERLHISSTTSAEPGAPSIGLRVLDSELVHLRHVEVAAGAGSPGRHGDASGNIAHGMDGGQPAKPIDDSGNNDPAPGGTPGLSACGTAHGGTGGRGGASGTPATRGEGGAPSADGGAPGDFTISTCNSAPCVCNGKPGMPGENGFNGGDGSHGRAGDGFGVLEGGTWLAGSGEPGTEGKFGGAGGGGGGGGWCSMNTAGVSKGGGGGGGGAGGCPGDGGKGGQSGGASIAVLLINGKVELESCTLTTAGGGKGGNGGKGGLGGLGGLGGAGGQTNTTVATNVTPNVTSTGGPGGNGGNGGKGGNGGHGGNGGGGPSVGVWCGSNSAMTQKDTRVTRGPAGQPGTGPGLTNLEVLQKDFHGCPPTSP